MTMRYQIFATLAVLLTAQFGTNLSFGIFYGTGTFGRLHGILVAQETVKDVVPEAAKDSGSFRDAVQGSSRANATPTGGIERPD
jgi:hypothetical protein